MAQRRQSQDIEGGIATSHEWDESESEIRALSLRQQPEGRDATAGAVPVDQRERATVIFGNLAA